MIKEDFLHYIWQSKKFELTELRSTNGQLIQILDFGYLNTDSGPDFFNAKIGLDGFVWAGNLEIHVLSSDWIKHKHQFDPAYRNVILHVVLEEDVIIKDIDGNTIPCLELKKRINKNELSKYTLLQNQQSWIPCERIIHSVSDLSKIQAIEKAAISRLEAKSLYIQRLLTFTNFHWEYSFLIMLFRYFGSNVNSDAFESLAKSIAPSLLQKEKSNPLYLEALLFGQAGMLNGNSQDEYYLNLQKRYWFQLSKYSLTPVPGSSFKLMRMRPSAFPTIRISQLSSLIYNTASFFDIIREKIALTDLRKIFDATAGPYWDDHYLFDKKSKAQIKKTSERFKENLMINVVVPFLHYYGKAKDNEEYTRRAIDLLEALPFENNRIMREWKNYDMPVKSALDSQGLLELKKEFCSNKKCLTCPVGHEIMR